MERRAEKVAEVLEQLRGKMVTIKKVFSLVSDEDKESLKLKPHQVRLIMKERLGYGWKTCSTRPDHSTRRDVVLNRRVFKAFLTGALSNGAHITYIDEMSVCSRHLKFRSWIHTKEPVQIVAPPPSEAISVMGAITEDGSFHYVLRKGTNKEEQVLEFLLDLDEKFRVTMGQGFAEFRKRNIIIMDNAAYHKTGMIKRFAEKAGVQMVILPQYTPEWNPIEIVWGWVKVRLSKMNMRAR